VFDAATWYLPHYEFSVLESSGQYVAFTSCAMTLKPQADHNCGFLRSTDSGLNWTWIEAPDNLSYLKAMAYA
jgi:recombinational DNA repair protein (RecF pathway)